MHVFVLVLVQIFAASYLPQFFTPSFAEEIEIDAIIESELLNLKSGSTTEESRMIRESVTFLKQPREWIDAFEALTYGLETIHLQEHDGTVFNALEQIFGKERASKLLYIFLKYHVNASEFSTGSPGEMDVHPQKRDKQEKMRWSKNIEKGLPIS